MKINFRRLQHTKNKRGMALLFALSILSVVLITVMLFASRARVESKVSAAHLANQSAKILAKSLIPRILITLEKSPDVNEMTLFSSTFSADENAKNANPTYDWIWKLETTGSFQFKLWDDENGTGTFPSYTFNVSGYPEYKYNAGTFNLPCWQYIHEPGNFGDEKSIIARFAFVTMPKSSLLNPNAIASHTYCHHLTESGAEGTDWRSASRCEVCARRGGVSAAELFFVFNDSSKNHKLVHRIGNDAQVESNLSNTLYGTRGNVYWTGIQDFMGSFGFEVPSISSSDDVISTYDENKKDLEQYFDISDTAYDKEAFWSDKNGDGLKDSDEYFHRFNMRRTDWEKIGVASDNDYCDSNSTAKSENDVYLLAEPKQYSQDDYREINEPTSVSNGDGKNNFNTGGIAWLNNWNDKKGDWGSSDDDIKMTKYQIAANLLNYCSPARRPVVSDVHPNDWRNKEPHFTGLKRTLYLNEVYFEIKVQAEAEKIGGEDSENPVYEVLPRYSFEYQFDAELIDMFFDTLGDKKSKDNEKSDYSAYHVEFIGTVSFEYNDPSKGEGAGEWTLMSFNLSEKQFKSYNDQAGVNPSNSGYYGYTYRLTEDKECDRISNLTEAQADDVKKEMKIRNLQVKIDRVLVSREKVEGNALAADRDDTFPTTENTTTLINPPAGAGRVEYVDCACLNYDSNTDCTEAHGEYQVEPKAVPDAEVADEKDKFNFIGSFQIDDPRQNLRRSDWENTRPDSAYGGYYENSYFSKVYKLAVGVPERHTIHTLPDQVKKSGRGAGTFNWGANYTNAETTKNAGSPGVYFKKNTSHFYGSDKKTQDYETAMDPAWACSEKTGVKVNGSEPSSHVSTAFIRHPRTDLAANGTRVEMPMESLWELGAIHRGSKWRTLNIAYSKEYDKNDQQKFLSEIGGGEYKDGDGPILDQVKMVNDVRVLGKINLGRFGSDDARFFTLGSLFVDMPVVPSGNYLQQCINNKGEINKNRSINDSASRSTSNDRIFAEADGSPDSGNASSKDYRRFVQALYGAIYGYGGATGSTFKDLTPRYNKEIDDNHFFRRTDILSTPMYDQKDPLKPIRGELGESTTDANEEQIIGRIINLVKVEATLSGATAVLIVQIIKDSNGGDENSNATPIIKDWNNDGKINDISSANLRTKDYITAQYQAGYRRFTDVNGTQVDHGLGKQETTPFIGSVSLNEKIYGHKGTYQVGGDTILGEAKILVQFAYDASNKKWKVVKYEYVD